MRWRSVTLVPVLLLAQTGAAQGEGVDLGGFSPPASEKSGLYTEPTVSPKAGDFNVAGWLGYAYRSIALEDAEEREVAVPLEHQLAFDYAGALGIGRSLALDFVMPTVLYQAGDETEFLEPLPRTALGDLKLGAKLNLVSPSSLGGLGFAVRGQLGLPTGSGAPYVSNDAVSSELRLLGELKLLIVDVGVTAGARFRQEREVLGQRFGHVLPWGASLTLRPQAFGWDSSGRWLWYLEVLGAAGLTPSFAGEAQSPVGIGISQRYTVGEVSVLAGAVLPLASAVGTPSVRGVISIGWAPRFYDEDDDGVEDERDECPELEEDHDAFEDQDGCPEFDNDGDGTPDPDDACATELEDVDGFDDGDGCRDPDNDRDGTLDAADACPTQASGLTPDPSKKGCPAVDSDEDDLLDSEDRCPSDAEDEDGFEDDDGCPERDNDQDGVQDLDDRCPDTPGQKHERPEYYGCPNPDRDGDTFLRAEDRCPTLAEDFDGDADDDGCPDDDSSKPAKERAKPLATLEVDPKTGALRVLLLGTFEFDERAKLSEKSIPLLRAVAVLLLAHTDRTALVSVHPAKETPADLELAFERASTLVQALRLHTLGAQSLETLPWSLSEAGRKRTRQRAADPSRPEIELRLEPQRAAPP